MPKLPSNTAAKCRHPYRRPCHLVVVVCIQLYVCEVQSTTLHFRVKRRQPESSGIGIQNALPYIPGATGPWKSTRIHRDRRKTEPPLRESQNQPPDPQRPWQPILFLQIAKVIFPLLQLSAMMPHGVCRFRETHVNSELEVNYEHEAKHAEAGCHQTFNTCGLLPMHPHCKRGGTFYCSRRVAVQRHRPWYPPVAGTHDMQMVKIPSWLEATPHMQTELSVHRVRCST